MGVVGEVDVGGEGNGIGVGKSEFGVVQVVGEGEEVV